MPGRRRWRSRRCCRSVEPSVACSKRDEHCQDVAIALHEIQSRLSEALGRRPEVLEAYLFGSVARGQAQAHSDVDVAVFVDPEYPLDRGFGYDAELSSELMSVLSTNKVDMVVLNRADPVLYHRVLRDGIRVLSRDLRETTVREGRALSRYCDFVPQLEKIRRASEARLRSGAFGR